MAKLDRGVSSGRLASRGDPELYAKVTFGGHRNGQDHGRVEMLVRTWSSVF